MDVHFFSTGANFCYGYYLAVVSALKTQKVDKVNLRMTQQPGGRFFRRLPDKVVVTTIDVPDLCALTSPIEHVEGVDLEKARLTHMKDHLGWKILYEQGGILLDLDTFCLDDLSCLLNDKEVATTPYRRWGFGTTLFPFNNGIVIAKPKSVIIKEALDASAQALSSTEINPAFRWGISGPIAFSNAVQRHYHLVKFLPPGTFGDDIERDEAPVMNPAEDLYKEDGVLNINARVVHLYASVYGSRFYDIDGGFIAGSDMLFARLVRQVLDRNEWDV